MIENLNYKLKKPKRCILFGSNGFIGKNLSDELEKNNISTVKFSSKDIDLSNKNSIKQIISSVRPEDVIIMLSALTPDRGRDLKTFFLNIQMIKNLAEGLQNKNDLSQFIYFSSDAVYSFKNTLINEQTPITSSDYYSLMHLTREEIIKNEIKIPCLIVRPTLVFGSGDTHNSYGPNRFIRSFLKENTLTLGGKGEETRDHIYIIDLIKMIYLMLLSKSTGTINLATGNSITFLSLAKKISKFFPNSQINFSKRNNEITYRKFDMTLFKEKFSSFSFSSLDKSIEQSIRFWRK